MSVPTKHGKDGHVHLTVAEPPKPLPSSKKLALRWAVVASAGLAVALYVAAYFQPWWHFTLFAPQYPKGLELVVGLKGLTGDVHEIDMLNHYIGMAHLEDAAELERRLATYGVG